jgi:hypothetical protein
MADSNKKNPGALELARQVVCETLRAHSPVCSSMAKPLDADPQNIFYHGFMFS